MSHLTLACVDADDAETLSALANLWCRAYNSTGPPLPLLPADASAAVFGCAEAALWRLAGCDDGHLVSMAFGVQARENDGAGASIPGQFLIRMVAVDVPFRNRGLGRETVSGILRLARESGFSRAHLWVVSSNKPARHLYERLGFRPSGRSKFDRGELISHFTASFEERTLAERR